MGFCAWFSSYFNADTLDSELFLILDVPKSLEVQSWQLISISILLYKQGESFRTKGSAFAHCSRVLFADIWEKNPLAFLHFFISSMKWQKSLKATALPWVHSYLS